MKPLCKMSLSSLVRHTHSSHGAQSFSDSSYFIMLIVPKIHFDLKNHVSSQLGKYGCHSRYPGWSQWAFGSEWPAVNTLTRCQATGATLKGGSTVEHTGFLTEDRDRVVAGPWPNEKIRTLKCWGLTCSCRLLSKTQTTAFIPGWCSVTTSPFLSLFFIPRW